MYVRLHVCICMHMYVHGWFRCPRYVCKACVCACDVYGHMGVYGYVQWCKIMGREVTFVRGNRLCYRDANENCDGSFSHALVMT